MQIRGQFGVWVHTPADPAEVTRVVRDTEVGSPQGGSISPLRANIFLHYALDNWAACWQRDQARGDVKIIRHADDVVVCIQYRADAAIPASASGRRR